MNTRTGSDFLSASAVCFFKPCSLTALIWYTAVRQNQIKIKIFFYFFKEPFSCPLSFRRSSKKDQFAKRILIRVPVSLPHRKNRLFKPFYIPSSFPAFIFSHIIVSEFCLLYGTENNIISFSVSASFLSPSVRRPPDSLRGPYISPLPHGFLLRLLISSVDTVRRVPIIKGVRK